MSNWLLSAFEGLAGRARLDFARDGFPRGSWLSLQMAKAVRTHPYIHYTLEAVNPFKLGREKANRGETYSWIDTSIAPEENATEHNLR